MRANVLWRKIARIIILISDSYGISSEKALDLFYKSRVYQLLTDPKYGLQLMSDQYILDEFTREMNS